MNQSNIVVKDGRCELHGKHRGYAVLVSSEYDRVEDDWTVQVYARKGRTPTRTAPVRCLKQIRAATLEKAMEYGLAAAEQEIDNRLGR